MAAQSELDAVLSAVQATGTREPSAIADTCPHANPRGTRLSGSSAWTFLSPTSRFDLLLSGVGKANAAAATARCLDTSRHALVLSLGIAGALPSAPAGTRVAPVAAAVPLALGSIIVATRSVYADEGVQTPGAWVDCAAMGFGPGPGFEGMSLAGDAALVAALAPVAQATGPVATVSTCSGTNTLAATIAARTGALAEAMEGAAVGQVAARLGMRFAEVRTISNTTGDREKQIWNMPLALAALRRVAARL